jgi:putative SOS response-associated peptidase YedK
MSRLHAVRASTADIAAHFDADVASDLVVPEETKEGLAGLIVRETDGRRVIASLDWGLPRLTQEMRQRGEPPGRIGLVANLTNPMWDTMVLAQPCRCLIILTHFANPDGIAGAKTRTWFSVKDEPILAWAGFWRNTREFGPVYAGMTMAANAAIPPTNDRMPALLERDDYDRWLHGSIEDVIRFQFREPFAADRMAIERSEDLWNSGAPPPATGRQLELL